MKSKKMLFIVMILSMLMLVVACSGESNNTTESSGTGSDTSNNATTDSQANNETIEESYTVAIQVVTLPGTEFAGQEEREAAINAIIEPAINCKVDIQEVWISELNQKTSMQAAGGEKLDILHVGTVSPLSAMVGSEILLDMNENGILEAYGQDLVNLFGDDLLAAGNVNGQQLAVPAKVFNANAKGFYYNKTLADENGIVVPEKINSLDALTPILEAVKATNPDMYPFYVGEGNNNYMYWLANYSRFGGNASYGAIMDETAELKIENLYATEAFKDFALTLSSWKISGLHPGDPTDTALPQDYFKAGKLFCVVSDINETIKADIGSSNTEFEVGWCELVEPQITNAGITEYMWGIASSSERPEKAMAFLNMLYSNADIANILYFGLEGDNYVIADGTDNIAIINGSYLPIFYRGGDSSQMLIKAPADVHYIANCEALEAAAITSPILGYSFDDTDYQTEASVITSAIAKYLPQVLNGMGGSEEGTLQLLADFNKELEAGGINDVIEANQNQLDAFLQSK